MSDFKDKNNNNYDDRSGDDFGKDNAQDDLRDDAIHAYEQLFNNGKPIDQQILDEISAEDENHSQEETQDVEQSGEIQSLDNAIPIERVPEKRGTFIRRLADPAEKAKVNKFDLVFIKIWSLIVSMVIGMANGINFAINGIFKRRAPDKYVRAFVSAALIILMIVLVTLPFKVQVNQETVYNIYGESLLPVRQQVSSDNNGNAIYKWGYANKKNVLKIKATYEEALPFMHNAAWVRVLEVEDINGIKHTRDYWKLIDIKGKDKGKSLQQFIYRSDLVDIFGNPARPCGDFTPEVKLAWVYNGSYGYIDASGNIKIDYKYKYAENFSEGYARVREGNSEYFINKSGKKISSGYEEVKTFSHGRGAVKYNGQWGFIDSKGKYIVEPTYDDVSPFLGEYAAIRRGDNYGIINQKGKEVVKPQNVNDMMTLSPELQLLIWSIKRR